MHNVARYAMDDIRAGMPQEDVISRNLRRELIVSDEQSGSLAIMHYCLDSKDRFVMHGQRVCNVNPSILDFDLAVDTVIRDVDAITIPISQLILSVLDYPTNNIPVTICFDEFGATSANSYSTYNRGNRFHFIFNVTEYDAITRKITLQPALHHEMQLSVISHNPITDRLTLRFRWVSDAMLLACEFLEVNVYYENPARFVCIGNFEHNLVSGVDKLALHNFTCSSAEYDSYQSTSIISSSKYYTVTATSATEFTLPIDMSTLAADPNIPSAYNSNARSYIIIAQYLGGRRFAAQWYHHLNIGDSIRIDSVNGGSNPAIMHLSQGGDGVFIVTDTPNRFLFTLNMINRLFSVDSAYSLSVTVTPTANSVRSHASTTVLHVANRRIVLPIKLCGEKLGK